MNASDDDSDLLNMIQKRNEQRHAQRMSEAKRAAEAIGKEPFDLAKLEQLCDTSHHGRVDPDDIRWAEYEDIYYLEKPSIMTIAELAKYVTLLHQWE